MTVILSRRMRVGWQLKHAAVILDVHEKKVTQSLDPALDKVAMLMRVDPLRTYDAIMYHMSRLPPMTTSELQVQAAMQRELPTRP